MGPVLDHIQKSGYDLTGSEVSYFSDWTNKYEQVGKHPSAKTKKCIVPRFSVNWDNGRLVLKTVVLCSAGRQDDALTPTTKSIAGDTSPSLFNGRKDNKPSLKHAMTATFNGNFPSEARSRPVSAKKYQH